MPIAVASMVGPADLRVRKGFGLLTCVGLRSGACVCIFDQETGVGGMAHITHGESNVEYPARPGKYANSGVEALIHAMERTGAHRGRLVAVLSGGSENPRDETDGALVLQTDICRAVQLELGRHKVTLLASDLGGTSDRSVMLDLGSRSVRVRTQEGEKILCDLKSLPMDTLRAA